MTHPLRVPCLASLLAAAAVAMNPPSAGAQGLLLSPTVVGEPGTVVSPPPASATRPSLVKPFVDVVGDIRHVPTRENLEWLVVGLGAALSAHAVDPNVTHEFSEIGRQPFKAGAFLGATPLELGAAFTTYAIGRATDNPRAMNFGGDLIRAQLLAELMTTGVKQAVKRARPEGSGYSFPSGHTTVSFASATVLQRHFGWRVGAPAYAVASYVAVSRVQMQRHYLSDVAFGAALGIVAGRTVTVGRGHLMLTPLVTPGGGGASFTWLGKK